MAKVKACVPVNLDVTISGSKSDIKAERKVLSRFLEITNNYHRYPSMKDFRKSEMPALSRLMKEKFIIADKENPQDFLLNFDQMILCDLEEIESLTDSLADIMLSDVDTNVDAIVTFDNRPKNYETYVRFDLIKLSGSALSITNMGIDLLTYKDNHLTLDSNNPEKNKPTRNKLYAMVNDLIAKGKNSEIEKALSQLD